MAIANRTTGSEPSRANLTSQLAQRVLAMIRERGLGPGDRLPPTKKLAADFAVAIPTMREALRLLQATGTVDIRHGSGVYVLRPEERLMLANPGYGTLETHLVLQVLDARLLIEPHLAELASRRATKDSLDAISAAVGESRAALGRGGGDYLVSNNQFHTAIARASGNLVLAQIVESLISLYSLELHVIDPRGTLEEIRVRDHAAHERLFEKLLLNDGNGARAIMHEHIDTSRSRLIETLAFESRALAESRA